MLQADENGWVTVELDGVAWAVSPIYVAPIGIGQAAAYAQQMGCELPTPKLVDAIWQAADLKLEPRPRRHNGTVAQMASAEVYQDQALRIEAQIGGRSLGVDFSLLAGCFKDVVQQNGKIGLYGWHNLNGVVIQPFFSGHAPEWIDYSQGLRLVRKL